MRSRSPVPVHKSEIRRTRRNILHLCSAPSCGCRNPCCRNAQTISWSPLRWSGKSGMSSMRCKSASLVAIQVCFNQESVISSCKISGASNSWPVQPSSSHIDSPDARSRKPIRSLAWFEYLSSVCMCARVCSVNRLGILMPQNFSGPCAST